MFSINGTLIYQRYVKYKFVLALSNVKPCERDLPLYSNVRERNYKGLSIYPEVRERILSVLSIYFDVRGSTTHSSECITDKKMTTTKFIDVRTRLLS